MGHFFLGKVLGHDQLMERARLMFQSPYLMKSANYILKGFCEQNPDIVREVLEEDKKLKGTFDEAGDHDTRPRKAGLKRYFNGRTVQAWAYREAGYG